MIRRIIRLPLKLIAMPAAVALFLCHAVCAIVIGIGSMVTNLVAGLFIFGAAIEWIAGAPSAMAYQCLGLGLFLAAATVFFRDIQNIWNVVTMAWMYLTPIFYTLDNMSPFMKYWIPKLNPMYIYITQMRDFVLNGGWPWLVLIWRGALVAVLMLGLGLFVFTKAKDKFILYI